MSEEITKQDVADDSAPIGFFILFVKFVFKKSALNF